MSRYGRKWERLAAAFLKRRPVCATSGCGRRSTCVDHIQPVRLAPWLKLEPSNWRPLCQACHNRITVAYERGRLTGACDDDGFPLDPDHPWRQGSNAQAISAVNGTRKANPRVAAALKRKVSRP